MRRASTPATSASCRALFTSLDVADASAASSAVLNCFLQPAVLTGSSSPHWRQFASLLGPFTDESLGVAGSMITGATTTSIHGYAFSIPKLPLLPDPNSIFILNSIPPNDLKVSAIVNVDDVLDSFNRMLCMIFKLGKILASVVKFKIYLTAIFLSEQLELRGIMPDVVNLSFLSNRYCHLTQMVFAVSLLGKILKMAYELYIITLSTLIKGLCLNGQFQMHFNFISTLIY